MINIKCIEWFRELLAASAKGGCAAGRGGKAVASGLYCVLSGNIILNMAMNR